VPSGVDDHAEGGGQDEQAGGAGEDQVAVALVGLGGDLGAGRGGLGLDGEQDGENDGGGAGGCGAEELDHVESPGSNGFTINDARERAIVARVAEVTTRWGDAWVTS